MATEGLPVTPSVVAWARERAGFTVEEASKSFRAIADWEAGTASPSYPQIERMADKFKCPVAVFFFPAPPDAPPARNSFRTLSDEDFANLPREVGALLRKAQAMQLNVSELNDGRNPAPHLLTRELSFDGDVSIDAMAEEVRAYLGVSVEQQREWGDVETALESWRDVLGTYGITIFKDAFRNDRYSGFCLYDAEFPLIYVNNSSAKTRQIFTLFHELAHLLFHTSGVDVVNEEEAFIEMAGDEAARIEVICNRFAGRFLVPDEVFLAQSAGLPANPETAALLANQFHVSREVIYRKFLDRDWISRQDYSTAVSEWARQARTGGTGGGNYYYTQIAYLGPQYLRLAFSRYYQGRIDEGQLADYLNIKPKNVHTFEETYARLSAA